MAFLLFDNRQTKTLPHDKAVHIELVRTGQLEGTPRQRAYARRIKKVYFGRQYEVTKAPREARAYKD